MNASELRYSLIYAETVAAQPWFAWFYFTGTGRDFGSCGY